MTEQPVETKAQWIGPFLVPETPPAEPMTEQEYLGNAPVLPVPEAPKQHYAPNAHRVPAAWPPPLTAISRSFELAEATILLGDLVNAEAAHRIAKKEATEAEDALSAALERENEARDAAAHAAIALQGFARKAAEQ